LNTVLMWIGGMLIAVLAALFSVPYFIDWNGYRGVFEEEASRVLGRDVRVGGSVNLRLLPAPYVRFENLRIADTSGITGAPLFQAGSFTMWLSVPPLLKGVLEAREIELEKPQLRLAADRLGNGNWRNLRLRRGSLPFAPSGVTLQSVRIVDGSVGFDLEGGGTQFGISGVNGELSAQDISGPFSFQGVGEIGGKVRELRFATTVPDDDGAFRVKGTARTTRNTDIYTLDARVAGLDAVASVNGTLNARLRLREGLGAPEAEIRGEINATPRSAEFKNIVVSFEDVGQPQLLTGAVGMDWGRRHRVAVNLTSRWIDIDRLVRPRETRSEDVSQVTGQTADGDQEDGENASPAASPGPRQEPLTIARSLFAGLIELLPEQADINAALDVEQVNLAGDSLSGVRVVIERSGGPLLMRTLRASLPGGARLDFAGRLEPGSDGPVFAGQVFLGGPSVARLTAWASRGHDNTARISDGPFAVSGALSLGTRSVELRDAEIEFSGVPVRGSLVWRDAPNRKLDLQLEGHEIDTRWIGVTDLDVAGLFGGITGVKPAARADGTGATGGTGALGMLTSLSGGTDEAISVRIRAGRMRDADTVLRSVDANIAYSKGKLDLAKLRFETDNGLSVGVDGDISFLEDSPRGGLKWVVGAKSKAALTTLDALLIGEAPSQTTELRSRLFGLAPLRLAGRLDLGARTDRAADIRADGTIEGRPGAVQVLLDHGLGEWNSGPVEAMVTLETDDAADLVRLASGQDHGAAPGQSAGGMRRAGRGTFKAVGIPAKDMLIFADVDSDGLEVSVSGRFVADASDGDQAMSLATGEAAIEAVDVREVMQFAGIRLPAGAASTRLAGKLDFESSDTDIKLNLRDVQVGESVVAGLVTLAKASDDNGAARRMVADLKLDRAALPKLLTGLTGQPPVNPPEPRQVSRGTSVGAVAAGPGEPGSTPESRRSDESPFTYAAFDLGLGEHVNGDVKLTVQSLDVGRGLIVPKAVARVALMPGSIDFKLTSQRVLNGGLEVDVGLRKAAAGVQASGKIELSGAQLDALFPNQKVPVATGSGALSTTFEGRALSPRALLSIVTGRGEIRLTDARARGLSPGSIEAVAETVLSGEAEDTDADFLEAVRTGLTKGELDIGTRTLPLAISDGVARIETFEVGTQGGTTTATIEVDIAQMRLESAWQITASNGAGEDDGAGSRAWPPVSAAFSGTLANLAAMSPEISADALQRELTVRRMERNVEELERLRRMDEEAAKRARRREEERRAREAAEAAAAAAAAANQPLVIDESGREVAPPPNGLLPGAGAGVPGGEPSGATNGAALPESVQVEELPPAAAPERRVYRPRRPQPRQRDPNEVLREQLFPEN